MTMMKIGGFVREYRAKVDGWGRGNQLTVGEGGDGGTRKLGGNGKGIKVTGSYEKVLKI